MPICFLCTVNFPVRELFLHFRKEHLLTSESSVSCFETDCKREFPSFNSLRKHFFKKHATIVSVPELPRHNLAEPRCPQRNPPPENQDVNMIELPDDQSDENAENPISPSDFKTLVENEVLVFLGECYRRKICRKDVDFIVESTSNFVSGDFLQVLQDKVVNRLKILNETSENVQEVIGMFEDVRNSFQGSSTEYKRLSLFTSRGVFVPPKDCKVGQSDGFKLVLSKEERKSLLNTQLNVQWIPMRETLSKFLNSNTCLEKLKATWKASHAKQM